MKMSYYQNVLNVYNMYILKGIISVNMRGTVLCTISFNIDFATRMCSSDTFSKYFVTRVKYICHHGCQIFVIV